MYFCILNILHKRNPIRFILVFSIVHIVNFQIDHIRTPSPPPDKMWMNHLLSLHTSYAQLWVCKQRIDTHPWHQHDDSLITHSCALQTRYVPQPVYARTHTHSHARSQCKYIGNWSVHKESTHGRWCCKDALEFNIKYDGLASSAAAAGARRSMCVCLCVHGKR